MFLGAGDQAASGSSIEVNTAIFAGSITKFCHDYRRTTLLDTPDQFDYDSACTMIPNLNSKREWSLATASSARLLQNGKVRREMRP